MANCGKCGKKLGLFEKKFDYKDESGNPLKYCSKCNEEFEEKSIKDKIAKRLVEQKNQKRLYSKKRYQNERQIINRIPRQENKKALA